MNLIELVIEAFAFRIPIPFTQYKIKAWVLMFVIYVLIDALFDPTVLLCAFIGFCLGVLVRHFFP